MVWQKLVLFNESTKLSEACSKDLSTVITADYTGGNDAEYAKFNTAELDKYYSLSNILLAFSILD